jgi:ankyrin repeat protein
MFFRAVAFGLVLSGTLLVAQDAKTSSDEFYTAIRANELARVSALIKQGADLNAKDARGMTPLMYSAVVGSPESMRLLLDNAADPNLTNTAGSTALMFSVTEMEKVRLLVDRGANVNAVTKFGRTPLLLAAMSDGSAGIVRLLVERGADVKAVDGIKSNALHAAATGNDIDTIRQLVSAGLDVNAANFAGFTPLMLAAGQANLPAVKMLLDKGANVNAVSSDGAFQKVKAGTIALGNWTPLLLASPYAPPSVLKALLDAGADANVKDVRGMTPLMLAVSTDRPNIEGVHLLLSKTTDVNSRSLAGESAFDWAGKIGVADSLTILKKAGGTAAAASPTALPAYAPADLRTAVQRSISLLERSSTVAAANGGCASCHHHNITDFAVAIGRMKNIQIDDKAAANRQSLTKTRFFSPLNMLERMDGPGSPDLELYALIALAVSDVEADRSIDAAVANILSQQRADGRWTLSIGGVARPPVEDGDVTRTFLGINMMKSYGPPGRARDIAARMERAVRWISGVKASTAEDRNTQLLALDCAAVERAVIERFAKIILAAQRPDGGWAQRDGLSSDAYATGQTLLALLKTGSIAPTSAPAQKAVKYLLTTQHADGSWYVKSRSPKFQPYFESDFPFGHDQWISAMATGWAATGLAMALP